MDLPHVRTRTVWVAAAVVFGIATLVSAVSGSPILALLLLLLTVGCIVASRRPPLAGGDDDAADGQDGTDR